MPRIGLVSISFRSLSCEELISRCRENGLPFIEWGSDVHAPPTDRERLSHIVVLGREAGVTASSYGTYFRLGISDVNELHDYVAAAKHLGTSILRIWGGTKNFEDLTADERSRIVDEGKNAARIARDAGVTLCLECHNKTVTNCLDGARMMMEEVDSPHLRMYWQPNQYRTVAENLAYAEAIAPYTDVIHVFQWKEKKRFPLSDGIREWRDYLSRFDGHQKLLLEFMPDDNPDTLAAEAASLKRILEEHK